MLKIAHRGASGYAPENTLKAFRLGIKQGADGMEFDIRTCKTGEPVIIHDATLKRTTNGKGYVRRKTLKELKSLDAGDGEQIPTLEEVLEAFAGKVWLFLEIKDAASIKPTAALVKKYGERVGYDKMPVIGFNLRWLAAVKKINPKILIGATPSDSGIPQNFFTKAKQMNAWSANPCIKLLTPAHMKAARENGLRITTWTANSKRDIDKARKLGVDAVLGDFPDRL